MSQWSWPGALCGLAFGAGLLLVLAGMPVRRRPGLLARLEPYLLDAPRPSRLLSRWGSSEPVGLRRWAAPALRRAGRWVDLALGGAASVRRRLERAGLPPDVEAFRAEQVLWGTAAGLVGALFASLLWLRRGSSLPSLVILVLCAIAIGVVARDQVLSRAVRRRELRIMNEFPTIAELLALAVTAGEGAPAALDRVARLSTGELSAELSECLARARAGASLPMALQGLADRTGLPTLARFVDGIVVAVERGTPLAEVLRAQAQDAREAGRHAVIEEGGKREIAMMVPVVFLVLPVTVLFAIYPGLSMLRLSI
ncbi:MAG TPA: type II secretion system F family protein [Segeticoccus sp.]|uniref:type II secretion system F family protein n=1 Tax=Segeticoccus sp. TaxID=2706531 RepID=UPI002D7FEE45|nr:type II secretion system F family protein [Segeticoccus sp.]HET8601668.1 type II secretion system F family protein [Segeticoccus sp.]